MGWIIKVGAQQYLTQTQKENNAQAAYSFFVSRGMSLEALCGLLGNMDWESSLNPGMQETGSVTDGYGLIQWTPASTQLLPWCGARDYKWYSGDAQCALIENEGNQIPPVNDRWLPTSQYPYSWSQFKALTDVEEATKAYLAERERAGVAALSERLQRAQNWYAYFGGHPQPTPPDPPVPPVRDAKKMPLYMMIKPQRL